MQFIDGAVRFLTTMLLAGLWQAALFSIVAWLALRVLPNANATTRHAILAVAFYASVVTPVVTAGVTFSAASDHHTPSRVAYHASSPGTAAGTPLREHQPAALSKPGAFSWPAPRRSALTLPRFVAIGLVVAWLLGAAFLTARLLVCLVHLERLKRDALPLPVEYRAFLQRWAAAAKGSRKVRLCQSSEVVIPIAVGLFDAMILVPEHFLDDFAPDDIDRVILHELAHLRRNDDWINFLERLAQAVMFFNPGILWLTAQLDLEREIACDDWVLQQNEPLPYATCLSRIVETTIWPYRAMSAPGAFITRRAMSVRIERLLSKHRDTRVRASLLPTGAVVAAFTVLCVGALAVSPSLAYTTASPAVVSKTAEPARKAARPQAATVAVPQRIIVYREKIVRLPASKPAEIAKADVTAVPAAPTTAPAARTTTPALATVAPAIPTAAPQETVAVATPGYIDELAGVGYTNLSVDELIRLRSVGVTADYIRQLEEAGFNHPNVEMLERLRALNVQPAYAKGMRVRFDGETTLDEIARAHAVGVTLQYVDAIGSLSVRNLTLDEASRLWSTGVKPDYINDLARAGYPALNIDQLQELYSLGIDAAFVQRAAEHGFKSLTIDQLVRLKTSDILH
jgi:beta-lactamase regulating signal transducer with metallopeptidase domain